LSVSEIVQKYIFMKVLEWVGIGTTNIYLDIADDQSFKIFTFSQAE